MGTRAVGTAAALWLLAGCAAATREAPNPAAASACRTASPPSAVAGDRESVTVALAGPVDSAHAPVPTDDAERFIFRAAYRTLVTVDCGGVVHPKLAVRWRRDSTGRVWTFELRPDATFWDGLPVRAGDVAVAWMRQPRFAAEWRVSVASPTTLVVHVPHPLVNAAPFAAPALAVARASADGGWPIGSGPYAPDTQGGVFVLRPARGSAATRPIVVRALGDPRDALDAGIDVVITDDASALDYARRRGDYVDRALPWATTYALAIPPGASWERTDTALAAAVRADARLAAPPAWWMQTLDCAPPDPPVDVPPPIARVIAYPRTDAVARDLATRLAAMSGEPRLEAVAVDTAPRGRIDALVVTPIPRTALDACTALNAVQPRGWTFVPLVDVRPHALIRRDAPAWLVDWDGTLRPSVEEGP